MKQEIFDSREIPLAVIGTVLEIDEIGLVGSLEFGSGGPETSGSTTATLGETDECRALVGLGQSGAGRAESRQPSPADAYAARA